MRWKIMRFWIVFVTIFLEFWPPSWERGESKNWVFATFLTPGVLLRPRWLQDLIFTNFWPPQARFCTLFNYFYIDFKKIFFYNLGRIFYIFYFVTNLVLVSFVCFFFWFFFVFDSSRLPFALLPCLPVQNRENLLFLSTMVLDFPKPHVLVVLLPIWFRLMGLCCISRTMDFQDIIFQFVCFLHGFWHKVFTGFCQDFGRICRRQ